MIEIIKTLSSKMLQYFVAAVITLSTYSSIAYSQGHYPIAQDRLRIINITYVDFSGRVHTDGKLKVLDIVAEEVNTIFNALFEKHFPIEKIKLMTEYDNDDQLSMADNNTSAYNSRNIKNSTKLSVHAYGLAIDLNPVQNPFVN